MNLADCSLDVLLNGRLRLYQSKTGYRFAIDAFLLAYFVTLKKGELVLELGTGNGIIALLLALRYQGLKGIVAVELQHSLASLAQRNVCLNRQGKVINVIQADVKDVPAILDKTAFDVVVSNPPYYSVKSGRINPNSERAIARHELKCSLEIVVKAAQAVLKHQGRLYLIYPAKRLSFLLWVLRNYQFEPKKMRFVHPYSHESANFILVEARKGAKEELLVLPPLVIYQSPKRYTPEVASYYGLEGEIDGS